MKEILDELFDVFCSNFFKGLSIGIGFWLAHRIIM